MKGADASEERGIKLKRKTHGRKRFTGQRNSALAEWNFAGVESRDFDWPNCRHLFARLIKKILIRAQMVKKSCAHLFLPSCFLQPIIVNSQKKNDRSKSAFCKNFSYKIIFLRTYR